jgi:ribonuclease BN (tRNA processing enzyme)
LVQAEGFALLLDFGTGSLSALQRYADLHAIDAIVLTHLHCDHMLDACSYMVVRRYAPDGPYPRVPLYGPRTAKQRLASAYGSPDEGSPDDVYDFHHLVNGSTFPLGPLTVTVEQVNHPVETYGVRVEHHGRVLTYSADTGMCEALDRLAHGADVFLCEASYVDGANNPPDLHLTGREAGEVAAKAGVGQLVLTHLVSAWGTPESTYQAAASTFDGPIELARPGGRYEI